MTTITYLLYKIHSLLLYESSGKPNNKWQSDEGTPHGIFTPSFSLVAHHYSYFRVIPLMRQRWSGWQRGKKKYVFIGDIYEILWNTCQMDVRSSSFVSNSRPTRHWRLKRKEPIRLSSHHPFPAAPFDDVDDNESTSDSTRLSKEPSHLVINVAMSLHLSEAEANEKSLSQV